MMVSQLSLTASRNSSTTLSNAIFVIEFNFSVDLETLLSWDEKLKEMTCDKEDLFAFEK